MIGYEQAWNGTGHHTNDCQGDDPHLHVALGHRRRLHALFRGVGLLLQVLPSRHDSIRVVDVAAEQASLDANE